MPFKPLSDSFVVSPQIQLEDVARAKSEGVTMIVNNRPEGESPDQTEGPVIASAAKAAGIDYVAIPVTHAGFSHPQVEEMVAALEKAEGGKILAYCRSGTRSTLLWALAEARRGRTPDEIARRAADAGYDVASVRPMIDAFANARPE